MAGLRRSRTSCGIRKADMLPTIEDVLEFWFVPGAPVEQTYRRWFTKDPEFDNEIRRRFGELHAAAAASSLPEWGASALGELSHGDTIPPRKALDGQERLMLLRCYPGLLRRVLAEAQKLAQGEAKGGQQFILGFRKFPGRGHRPPWCTGWRRMPALV